MTEYFLQKFVLTQANILVCLVGQLTFYDQKFLSKIRNECGDKTLFILHNLQNLTTLHEVDQYINEVLKCSLTFKLKENKYMDFENKSQEIKENNIFYTEIYEDIEKNDNNKDEKDIVHLIMARENTEAGDYYNNFTIKFIENYYQNITDLKSFDVFETIKQRFINLSKEIIEKNNENKNFDIIFDKKAIKLQTQQKIILKRCFIDELGFSNLKGNGFEPNFNYYKKDNKIIVRLEAPGNSTIDYDLEYSGEYTIIRLKGT